MENYILYEELGEGASSVVYKGRRKGDLNYVALICTDKAKRLEITNHVRLSLHLDHPNLVSFYEWYETSKNLWMVVELNTGGSLESVIRHDGFLPEDVVRRFGWDLAKGLRYLHELGIIFSDLNPAKILLDGSGILKLSNLRLAKAEGETLEDFLSLLSTADGTEEQDSKESNENIKKRLQGCPNYSAPEVVQGSETNRSTDLWALGCILYYMYTGKPPFFADTVPELQEMILYREPLPLRQQALSSSLPTEDFQDLLKGLLKKNPKTRMDWPELLDHPFWAEPINKEEQDAEEEEDLEDLDEEDLEEEEGDHRGTEDYDLVSSRQIGTPDSLTTVDDDMPLNSHSTTRKTDPRHHVSPTVSEASKNSQTMVREVGKETGGEDQMMREDITRQICQTVVSSKAFTLDNVSELRPKSGVDEDNTEAIFLLSSCASSRRGCYSTDPLNQTPSPQASTGTDVASKVKSLLHTDSDLTVNPVMDNPKILKGPAVKFDHKTLCVPAYSAEKLQSFSDEEWTVYIQQLCSALEDQSPSAPASSAPPASSTAIRTKLNLLCYLSCVVGQKVVANRLINSTLLPVLTQQIRQAPNWDVKSKVLRVLGLLALHCDHLEEESPVSEVVSTLSDLLRENLRNSKVKQFLLPPLGEFLYLIASQEKKRGSPEGLWFVPAAAYTGLMRSLREGDDSVVHHMAAKVIENISTVISGPSHPLPTAETGSALWYLFTHSTVEAVRVTAISSLSRLTRVVPAVFLAVIDTCGPAAILEAIGGAGARVQQHLLTAMGSALLTSRIHTHRVTQNKDLVLKVLRCLESPSTVTRAKTLLLLLLLIQDNTHTLQYCCQHRLVMYLERDLRKAIPLRENTGQSGYLSQCLDSLTVYLTCSAPLILDDMLCALQSVIGRKHPLQLRPNILNTLCQRCLLCLHLFHHRSEIVNKDFLTKIGLLLKYITSIESKEVNLTIALGAAVCEEWIRTSLSIVEVLSQHHALVTPHQNIVGDAILPPLTTMAFSRNVEWSVFVLRVLSELSLALLVHESDGAEEDEENIKENGEDGGSAAEREENGHSFSQISALISTTLLPRYESLLRAAEPVPLYALKLLLSLTEHSTQMCRLIKHSRILPTVLQLIMADSSNLSSGLILNAVALLCNLSSVEPLQQQGLIEMVVSTLPEAARIHVDTERQAGRRVSHLVLQALLELLHNILKQISVVVRFALQSQRLSCPAVDMEAAEKLLLENRPLSQLSTLLIHMLSTENQEVWEESFQCLSLLVQLYGGEGCDCLSPSCLQSFVQVLHTHMHTETPRVQRTTLRILKRLVQTTEQAEVFKCPEGAELISLLNEINTSNRCHSDVISLAAETLHQISGS